MSLQIFKSLVRRDYYDAKNGIWCVADEETPKYMALKKASQASNAWTYQANYGLWTVYFCAVVIFVAGLKNLYFKAYDKYAHGEPGNGPSMFFQLTAFNRYISYRKLPSKLSSTLGLPRSFGALLVTCGFAVFTLAICFIPHPWYRACSGFGSPPLATRADVIATAFVPFIFILSGKTNIVSTITGISYDRMNIYHQTAGILCLVFSWVHAIPFYWQPARENKLAATNKSDNYYISGIPPIICLSLMVGASLPSFRKRYYELFVHTHWVLAILFYVSLFYHVWPLLGTQKYMIATIVIWGVQLAYRALVKGYLAPKNFLKTHIAEVKYLKAVSSLNDCIEVNIPTSFQMRWTTMQHIFVRFANEGAKLTQSHPFSIASSPHENKIKLLIKPKLGITRHILSRLKESSSGVSQMKLLVDGPYGGLPRQLAAFDTVFMLASGTGITAILPALYEAVTLETVSLLRVRFDWCVRTTESIAWIQQELEEIIAIAKTRQNLQLELNIYVSNGYSLETQTDDSANEGKKELALSPLQSSEFVNMFDFKLNIRNIIRNEFILGHRNMVIVSGSDSMCQDTSNCVASLQKAVFLDTAVEEIYLHTEQFGW